MAVKEEVVLASGDTHTVSLSTSANTVKIDQTGTNNKVQLDPSGNNVNVINNVNTIEDGEHVYNGWSEITAATNNALATATKAAGAAGTRHHITGVYAGFSATVSGKLLEVKKGSTVVFRTFVYDKAYITFPSPIPAANDEAVSAELAASGTGGTTGVVSLVGFTLTP